MKGCVIAILFIVLLFFGTAGWICATVAGIILLASSSKNKKINYFFNVRPEIFTNSSKPFIACR